jgi:hypothetical protein
VFMRGSLSATGACRACDKPLPEAP